MHPCKGMRGLNFWNVRRLEEDQTKTGIRCSNRRDLLQLTDDMIQDKIFYWFES